MLFFVKLLKKRCRTDSEKFRNDVTSDYRAASIAKYVLMNFIKCQGGNKANFLLFRDYTKKNT